MTALHTAVRAAVRRRRGRGVGRPGRQPSGRPDRRPRGHPAGRASAPPCCPRVGTAAPRLRRRRRLADAGMTTAEYAVGTLAACAFAAVLIAVVRSGAIKSALSGLITTALAIAS